VVVSWHLAILALFALQNDHVSFFPYDQDTPLAQSGSKIHHWLCKPIQMAHR